MVRGGIGRIKDFDRVQVRHLPELGVDGGLVDHLTLIFAHLLDNAARYSPPTEAVVVSGKEVPNGVGIEIQDAGKGLSEEKKREAEQSLAGTSKGPGLGGISEDANLGLRVVGSLARRYGIRVTFADSPWLGTSVVVVVPHKFFSQLPAAVTESAPAPAAVAAPYSSRSGPGLWRLRKRWTPPPAVCPDVAASGTILRYRSPVPPTARRPWPPCRPTRPSAAWPPLPRPDGQADRRARRPRTATRPRTARRLPYVSSTSTALKRATSPMTQQGTDVSWALRDLTESIKEIRFALVASSDGKAITSYGAEDPDDVDRFAAVVAGLQALAQPVAKQFPKYAGQLRLAMIEVDGGHLFVVRAGVETYLGVLAREGLDQGLLGHQMRDLARRMGELLGTTPRLDEHSG